MIARSKVGSISVATARRELARRESEERTFKRNACRSIPSHLPPRFIPLPAKIVPTGNRYRSYRFVSFPSPDRWRIDGAERSRLPFRLFDVATASVG